jgi:hypothetical protein
MILVAVLLGKLFTLMTDTKTLLQRIATAISTAPQGETYKDCRNNEAKAVLEEIADWLEEERLLFIAPTGLRNQANK